MPEDPTQAATAFQRIGKLLREATPPPSLKGHVEGRMRLVASLEHARARSRVRSVFVALVFVGGFAVVAALFVRARAPSPIAWHVENGAVGAHGYISIAPTSPSARLVFEDGSDVTLAAGFRGRVARTSDVGAELVLEQGRAGVRIQHRERADWLLEAGPFAVRVTGTEFSVAWAAESETLDVWMRSGRVAIVGPVLGDALTLSAGQHVRARVHDGTVQIDSATQSETPETLAAPAAASSSPSASEPSANEPIRTSAPPPSSAVSPPTRTWSKLLAQGDFARVVREAESEDVGRALAARPLPDLRALGDSARYAGNAALAMRAYLAVRARFPSSADARTAAFLLGRVVEEQLHASGDAIGWYEKYLGEAPAGAFAGDALGRKMLLVSTSAGRDAARPFAEQYLRRFADGPYAAAAHDLTP
jgi:hypothetical protein